MEIQEVRTALIEVAKSMACRVIEQARSADLASGTLEAKEVVAEVTWHIVTAYSREQDLVVIQGHPEIAQHPIFAIFGNALGADAVQQMQSNHEAAFLFSLPASWLVAAES